MAKLMDDPKVQKAVAKAQATGFKVGKAGALFVIDAELESLNDDVTALGKASAKMLKRIKTSIKKTALNAAE